MAAILTWHTAAKILNCLVGPAVKCIDAEIELDVRYILHFRMNVDSYETSVGQLRARCTDVTNLIEAASRNDEVVREAVMTWHRTVEAVLTEATSLIDEAARNNSWFKGWFCSRCILSRRAEVNTPIVQGLVREADAFGIRVSDPRIRVSDPRRTVQCKSFGEVDAFPSRVFVAAQIIQALQDENIRLFGVYGMAGVGKTTLVTEIANHLETLKRFDDVVMVRLTRIPDMHVIQGDIANQLGLILYEEDSPATRENRLFQRLNQDKKTLIVIDNLWERFELAVVGIRRGMKNCKVLFTTRDQNVCNSMETGKYKIEVKILSAEESWQLFRQKADFAVDSPAFQGVATKVLNECQGLPLLIVTLGRALYGKDRTFWDAALQSLRNSTILPSPIFRDMQHVLSVMKLSYDYLESAEVKMCFLFCCLFPDGYPISMEQLFYYMMGEKLLQNEDGLESARLHLHIIVDKLTSACLLFKAKSGCFMMHDVVRDVAIFVASDSGEGHGFIVKAGTVSRNWPDVELTNCKRLSFITTTGSHMNWSLPNQIQGAHLLTLSFNGNEKLVEIPTDCFEEARNLLSLDLSYTGINEIPVSIECLVNLRTLLLEGCPLKDVHLKNKWERLEIFSLRYSSIRRFSMSGEMISLKLLDLSRTSTLEHIGGNIISSFHKLEELYLFDSFRAWEPEEKEPREESDRFSKGERGKYTSVFGGKYSSLSGGQYASLPEGKYASLPEGKYASLSRGEYASLSEVTSLRRLTSLEFHVGDLGCLSKDISNWENLTRFKIAAGVIDNFSPFGIDDGMQMEKSMYIELCQKLVATWVKVLLGRTNFLQLKGSWSLSDLVQLDSSPEEHIFSELKVLILSDTVHVTCLIPCDMLSRLQNLHKLVIINCKDLESLIEFGVEDQASSSYVSFSSRVDTVIFSNLHPSSIFPNLTYLRVCECSNLKYFLPIRVFRLLFCLEVLYIRSCQTMKVVFVHGNAADDGDGDVVEAILPKLKVLCLEDLPILTHIVREHIYMDWPALEELTVKGCLRLEKHPLGRHSAPKLEKVIMDECWIDVEHRYPVKYWFERLEWADEEVGSRLLLLLGRVHLEGCKSLKDAEHTKAWPLTLRDLRVIHYRGACLIPYNFLPRLLNLEVLEVHRSWELEKLVDFIGEDKAGEEPLSFVDSFVGSSSSQPVSMTRFFKSTPSPVFADLRWLKVSHCDKLKYLFPMRVIRALTRLLNLKVSGCNKMEMVIVHENAEDDGDADKDKEILPMLKVLSLEDLPILSHIVRQDIHVDWPSLEKLTLYRCSNLKKLPLGLHSVPKLAKLEVRNDDWFDELHWDNKTAEHRLRYFLNSSHLKECTSLKDVELLDPCHPALRSLRVTNYKGASLVIPGDIPVRLFKLDRLVVDTCEDLEKIIEVGGEKKAGDEQGSVVDASAAGPSLSSLTKSEFSKLVPPSVFPNLTYLQVSGCHRLKYLLPLEVVRDQMLQLEELIVKCCNALEMVIEYDAAEYYDCADRDKAVFPNLKRLHVASCDKLKYLFPVRVFRDHMLQLRVLRIKDCNSMEMIVEERDEDGDNAEKNTQIFPSLTHLKVMRCNKLKYLLPMRIIRDMLRLSSIKVRGCNGMNMIIAEDDGDVEKDKTVLPELEFLTLDDLPQLSSFVRKGLLFDWPSLKSITVYHCFGLKKLPVNAARAPKLWVIWAKPRSWCDNLEWENEESRLRLQGLLRPLS